MNFKGERFHIPLDEDDDYDEQERQYISKAAHQPPKSIGAGLIKDVHELSATSSTPPVPPTFRNSSNDGFPSHKKRTAVSRFKAARHANADSAEGNDPSGTLAAKSSQSSTPEELGFQDQEKDRIDKENQQRLAQMSNEEIEKERSGLMEGLSPSLIQRLLRRANINSDTGAEDFPHTMNTIPSKVQGDQPRSTKKVAFKEIPQEAGNDHQMKDDDNDIPPVLIPTPPSNATEEPELIPPAPSIHFPHPPVPPDLDPSSPTFLADLHTKYFPTLPSDPSKLAWMTDPDEGNGTDPATKSPYHPTHASIPSAALRFSFRGTLIPPRTARSIPVTKGLHHHGEAPESAGYTVPELAHLARSSFPAQRCVAFQALGRLMYRLGRGEFGMEESVMAQGLWKCIKEGRVLETLQEEAERLGGHLSAKAYATEALWLWQVGGGQRWKAT